MPRRTPEPQIQEHPLIQLILLGLALILLLQMLLAPMKALLELGMDRLQSKLRSFLRPQRP